MNGNDLIKGFGIGQGLVNNTITNATRLAGLREWQQEQQDRAALRNALGGIPQDLSPLQQSNAQLNVLAQHYAATGKHADLLAIHKLRQGQTELIENSMQAMMNIRTMVDDDKFAEVFKGFQDTMPEIYGNMDASWFKAQGGSVVLIDPRTGKSAGFAQKVGDKWQIVKDPEKKIQTLQQGDQNVPVVVQGGEVIGKVAGFGGAKYKDGGGASGTEDKSMKDYEALQDNYNKTMDLLKKMRDEGKLTPEEYEQRFKQEEAKTELKVKAYNKRYKSNVQYTPSYKRQATEKRATEKQTQAATVRRRWNPETGKFE